MATLTKSTNNWNKEIEVNSDQTITLSVGQKYVDRDIVLNLKASNVATLQAFTGTTAPTSSNPANAATNDIYIKTSFS